MNSTPLKTHRSTPIRPLDPQMKELLVAAVRALTPYLLAACILFMFEPARACAAW